jgi:hypothetical protein
MHVGVLRTAQCMMPLLPLVDVWQSAGGCSVWLPAVGGCVHMRMAV